MRRSWPLTRPLRRPGLHPAVNRLVHLNQLPHLSQPPHLNQLLHLSQRPHLSRRLHLNSLLLLRPGLLALQLLLSGRNALLAVARLWKSPVSFVPDSRLDAVADDIVTTAGNLEARSSMDSIR